jgi:hypothetical protein
MARSAIEAGDRDCTARRCALVGRVGDSRATVVTLGETAENPLEGAVKPGAAPLQPENAIEMATDAARTRVAGDPTPSFSHWFKRTK